MQWITDHATLVAAAVALLSEVLALIPEDKIKANSVLQLAVNAARAVLRFVADFATKKPGGGAGAAAAVLLLALGAAGCASQQRVTAYTATIATVQTVDEGVAAFTGWAVIEEQHIAEDAISACKGSATKAAFVDCTEKVTAPRRAPIDKAKTAIRIYRGTVAAASSLASVDLAGAAAAVIRALSDVGIKVGG